MTLEVTKKMSLLINSEAQINKKVIVTDLNIILGKNISIDQSFYKLLEERKRIIKNIVDPNPTTSIIALNFDGINFPLKSRTCEHKQNVCSSYIYLYFKDTEIANRWIKWYTIQTVKTKSPEWINY